MNSCIIFDCDGTLVDSETLCNLAFEIMLKEYGVSVSASSLMERFRGEKLSRILESIKYDYDVKLNHDFVDEYRIEVEQLFSRKLKAFPGVRETLSQIILPMCVASSGPRKKIEQALTITDLIDFFDDNLFSSYSIGSWKPEPDIFLHAANMMGCSPKDCIVIEDSLIGISAAKEAGMQAVLFDPYGIHIRNVSVKTIKSMAEILQIAT